MVNQAPRTGNAVNSDAEVENVVDILVPLSSSATPIPYNQQAAQNILNRNTPVTGNMVGSDGKVYNIVDLLHNISPSQGGQYVERLSVIPQGSEENAGRVVCYTGDDSESYTHGYIYECKEEKQYSGIIGFEPSKIGFDYTKGVLLDFFKEATPDYLRIVRGTFTYSLSANLWTITGYDSEDNEVFSNYKLYTEDLEEAGFVMLNPMGDYSDGEVLDYSLKITQESASYSWVRIDVQPQPTVQDTPLQGNTLVFG